VARLARPQVGTCACAYSGHTSCRSKQRAEAAAVSYCSLVGWMADGALDGGHSSRGSSEHRGSI
jgi:hypothetical protein